jgi:hypothetical protein
MLLLSCCEKKKTEKRGWGEVGGRELASAMTSMA